MRLLQEQPQRMAQERAALEKYAKNAEGFKLLAWSASTTGDLSVNFELNVVGLLFNGVLVYPEFFPDVPAFVRPKNGHESWSSHQYLGTGVLCLEYGPDNWHPGITGVDLVRSATALIGQEILHKISPRFGPVPSRHRETVEQALSEQSERLLVTKGLKQLLTGPGRGMAVQLNGTVDWLRHESVALVVQAGDPLALLGDVPDAIYRGPGFKFQGVAVPVPTVAALSDAKDALELKDRLGPVWPWNDGDNNQLLFLLAHDPAGEVCSYLLKMGSGDFFRRYYPVTIEAEELQRLPAHFSKLSGVSVAIVGLGSLGSKIAVSLARAGIKDFVLVDDDVLLPPNLVRNEFNWTDVGFSKVEAAVRAVKLVAPDILVTTWPIRIAGQGNPSLSAKAAQALAACTLVIDATANPGAFVALAALTKRAGNAMLWGEVFGGGGGALMARSLPGVDAGALSIRSHLNGVMKTMAPAPTARAVSYGVESDGVVYVASDADVGSLAASMTQFSLDTLCADSTDYPAGAYLIGFRKFWEFRCPFDVIPVDCPKASETTPAQPLSEEEQQAILAIQKSIGEDASAANLGAS